MSNPILDILTRRVRHLSVTQVATTAFAHTHNPLAAGTQWLRRQAVNDLVVLRRAAIHPELNLVAPLVDYHPGDAAPNFDALAWQTRSRWSQPAVMTHVASATRKATRLTGGVLGGRALRLRELTHDVVGVAAVYLKLRHEQPQWAEHWLPEEALRGVTSRKFKTKVPDAVIALSEPVIVEFAGSYTARKLRLLYAEYAELGRFQIW